MGISEVRRPARKIYRNPFSAYLVVGGFLAGLAFVGFALMRFERSLLANEWVFVLSFPLLWVTIPTIRWFVFGPQVLVTDNYVLWRGGGSRGELDWDRIERIGTGILKSRLEFGLVERGTGTFHLLPVKTRELYGVLAARLGSLGPRVEGELFNLWSQERFP